MASENKLETLRTQLGKLNKKLPATVYIPFINARLRNSIVLHVPPLEGKIFITKGKTPYLVALEVFDPLEIVYELSSPMPSPSIGPMNTQKTKKIGKKTPEHELKEKIEKILKAQFNKKPKQKKTIEEKPIIIEKLKEPTLERKESANSSGSDHLPNDKTDYLKIAEEDKYQGGILDAVDFNIETTHSFYGVSKIYGNSSPIASSPPEEKLIPEVLISQFIHLSNRTKLNLKKVIRKCKRRIRL
jgi:hypothetical protein